MRDLLQFMYHGEVSVKREDLTSFIGTAEVLQIKGLTNKEVRLKNRNKSICLCIDLIIIFCMCSICMLSSCYLT